MCSEYTVKTSKKDIDRALGVITKNLAKQDSWNFRAKLTAKVPVVGFKDNQFSLTELTWPVRPFPNSRLSQLESNKKKKSIAEAEDQIVRIYEVPLWKKSFEEFPCLVPMSSLCEPAYWGEDKGCVVEFTDPENELLFVPSILIKPSTPASAKLDGVSLLTHTASEQMLHYHHRLLMLLKAEDAHEYLKLGKVSPQERFQFLLDHRYIPEFNTRIDRKMAPVWKNKVEKHEQDLAAELKYLAALKREGIKG